MKGKTNKGRVKIPQIKKETEWKGNGRKRIRTEKGTEELRPKGRTKICRQTGKRAAGGAGR